MCGAMMTNPDRTEILAFLRDHKDLLKERFGVESLGLAGSCARDQARPLSDIDIIVRLDSENTFRSFFGLLHFLQDNLHPKIDLATEASLKPRVKASILKDIRYV
jgi:predicted nucleotidyltransferase